MRFTNICLEGPDCSGKTTLFNNIHKATNYKYNIQDRSCLSMYVFACMYNRDQKFWYNKLMQDLSQISPIRLPYSQVLKEDQKTLIDLEEDTAANLYLYKKDHSIEDYDCEDTI